MLKTEMIINYDYGSLNPIQLGHEYCKPGHFFGPAVRTYWLLHYIIKGKGIFIKEGKRYEVRSGDIFVINPYVETYYEANKEDPWEYIWIGYICHGKPPYEFEKPVVHHPELGKVFEAMIRCRKMDNGRSAFLCAKLWEMFYILLEQKNSKMDYVEMAVNCMESEYMLGITVQQIADRLNLSRSYFSTIFSKETGISPQQYLTNLRMEKAAELMVYHGQTPSLAAYSTGYTDIFNFSKMFKRHFGVSPRKYILQNSTK